MFIRQPMSPPRRTWAPVRPIAAAFSDTTAFEIAGYLTQNVPPNPQQTSLPHRRELPDARGQARHPQGAPAGPAWLLRLHQRHGHLRDAHSERESRRSRRFGGGAGLNPRPATGSRITRASHHMTRPEPTQTPAVHGPTVHRGCSGQHIMPFKHRRDRKTPIVQPIYRRHTTQTRSASSTGSRPC